MKRNILAEAVKEFLTEEKKSDSAEELDKFQYAALARQLVMRYEDGTVAQDVSKLVDNFVASHKATTGKSLDAEKLYDAMMEEMINFVTSTNVRTYGGH